MKSNILTHYANETIQKHTHQIPPFVLEQLNIVIEANKEINVAIQEQLNLKVEHQKLTDQKRRVMEGIYSRLRVAFAILQVGKDDLKKRYFPYAPSNIFQNGEMMLELLKNINTRIEKDVESPLIAYKDQMIADQEALEAILIACYDTKGNGQMATAKKQEAVRKWGVEYLRLKGYLKYALLDSEYNYRIFFKDLTLTASRPETDEELAALMEEESVDDVVTLESNQ